LGSYLWREATEPRGKKKIRSPRPPSQRMKVSKMLRPTEVLIEHEPEGTGGTYYLVPTYGLISQS